MMLSANLFFGAQALLDRAAQRQARDFTHLCEYFGRSRGEISGIHLGRWDRRGCGRRGLLCKGVRRQRGLLS